MKGLHTYFLIQGQNDLTLFAKVLITYILYG